MLADEHHLEFVDLERFNLDASASYVIPVAVARKHHVVPIGRKFGAPVVATSNPADVVAMDDLRAVIGREFVAVVASGEQIDSCPASHLRRARPTVPSKRKSTPGQVPSASTSTITSHCIESHQPPRPMRRPVARARRPRRRIRTPRRAPPPLRRPAAARAASRPARSFHGRHRTRPGTDTGPSHGGRSLPPSATLRRPPTPPSSGAAR